MNTNLLRINMKQLFLTCLCGLILAGSYAQVDHQLFPDQLIGMDLEAATPELDMVISPSPTISPLRNKINKATFQVQWTVDDVFLLGKASMGTDVLEDYTISFVCRYYEVGNTIPVLEESTQLVISSEKAEAVYAKDITGLCNSNDLEHIEVEVTGLSSISIGADYASSQTDIQEYIRNHRIFRGVVEMNYGVDFRLESTQLPAAAPQLLTGAPTVPNGRVYQFDWTSTAHNFPNYEIQILKLENTTETSAMAEEAITAVVDWNNAMKIETTNDAKAVRLTVAEGTGFYVWRVRAVGNYFSGGFGNAKNWGPWSNSYAQGQQVTISLSDAVALPFLFFLEDPDDEKNWMYSRTIVEENKIGEGMVYANNLLQSVQNQAYSSSTEKSLVSQTVMDYLGRPALTTLPVPLSSGGLNGYQDQFFLNGSDELYTAGDFDSDQTIQDPNVAKDDAGSGFSYYSDNNTNDYTIPDAEGYPFARTIFLTDGSGRVAEASGVGKIHAIGQGKTSRIFYGTPSDDELIAIFGDEAPPAVSILKTITLDPNGTASINYTTIEGVTIATAMSSVTPDNLLAIDSPGGTAGKFSKTVEDEVVVNTLSDSKFISSKVLALDQETEITIDYFPCTQSGIDVPEAGCPGGNCNFEVRFIITNLITGEKFGTSYTDVSAGDCSNAIPGSAFNWSVIEAGEGLYQTNGKVVTLPAGNWKIQKIVTSMTDVNTMYEIPDAQQYLSPLVELVANWMNYVDSEADQELFAEMLDTLITNLETGHNLGAAACSGQPADCILTSTYQDVFWTGTLGDYFARMVNDFAFPASFVFHPDYTLEYGFELDTEGQPTSTPNPEELVMTTACCGSLATNIPQPEAFPVCKTIDAILEDENAELTPEDVLFSDLFRVLYAEIMEDPSSAAYQLEWGLPNNQVGAMNGFGGEELTVGGDPLFVSDFDDMVYHMLTDQYFTGNAYQVTPSTTWMWDDPSTNMPTPVYNATGDRIPTGASAEFYGPYYTCDVLYGCWYSSVRAYFEMKKTPSGFNIYDESNDDETGETEDPAEDHYDDEESADGNQGLLQQLVNFLISGKMDKFSDDLADEGDGSSGASPMALQYDIPNTFLQCTGRKFAAIIDMPADDVDDNLNPTSVSSILEEVNADVFLDDLTSYSDGKEAVYAKKVEEVSQGQFVTTLLTDRMRYENIKSPVWMFKYFEYNPELDPAASPTYINTQTNAETTYPLSSEAALELSTCYHDFSSLGLCYSNCGDTDHHNWNAQERYEFYIQVANLGVPDDLDDDDQNSLCGSVPTLPAITSTDLVDMIDSDFNSAIESCSERQDYFRSQIVDMLEMNCYIIVECADGSDNALVSEAQVDAMVQQAVESCGAYVEALRTSCVDSQVNYPDYEDNQCVMLIPISAGGVEVCQTMERIITLYNPVFQIPEKLLRVRTGAFIPFMNDLQSHCNEGSPFEVESEEVDCDEMNSQYTEIISAEP